MRPKSEETARVPMETGRSLVAGCGPESDEDRRYASALRGFVCALAILLAGCASRPVEEAAAPAPVEKTVLKIDGVKHGPILVTPDWVVAGGMLRGTVSSQTPAVLVQAMLETPPEPMGEVPLSGRADEPIQFALAVPPDAFGTIVVRAIDRNRLYTDKWIEIRPAN